jgi:hypothetical protein
LGNVGEGSSMKTIFDEIPKNWQSLSLKRIVKSRITDGPHETPTFVDQGIPFASTEAVENGSINFDRVRGYITPEQHKIYSRKSYLSATTFLLLNQVQLLGK